MLKYFIVLIALLACVCAGEIDFENCGSSVSVKKVVIDACSDESCIIVVERNTSFSITLNTGENTYEKVDATLFLHYLGVNSKIETTPSNPCDSLHCPLSANYQGTYAGSFTVNTSIILPGVQYRFKFVMTSGEDGNQQQLVCFTFPIELVYGS